MCQHILASRAVGSATTINKRATQPREWNTHAKFIKENLFSSYHVSVAGRAGWGSAFTGS
jgi:hypothetical protein